MQSQTTYLKVVILLEIFISVSPSFVNVEYLLRKNRFNNSSYIDYYFNCSVLGPRLTWALNQESLVGYPLKQADQVVVSTVQNFSYVTTLLYQKEGDEQSMFISILIVTSTTKQDFEVTCSNALMTNTTGTTANPVYAENVDNIRTKGGIIALEHVFSGNLIHNSSSLTHILTCGIADVSLTWGINGEGVVFGQNDRIGDTRTERPDGSTVLRQAILIADQSFETTSVIFVTSNSNITVTCSFSPHSPAILFVLAKSSDLFSEAVTVSSTNSTTLSTAISIDTGTSEFLTSGMLI